jgi:triphosphoribosyl-dephospho-CoA synthase
MATQSKAGNISQCLELAILLEASAHKPGNVSVVTNFERTRYEHFLASAVAATPSFEYAAEQGMAASEGQISAADVGVGKIIRDCVADIDRWQRGGNTLLGTIILLSPIAVAAGMVSAETTFEIPELREKVKVVTQSTTPQDAVNVYEAIKIANPAGLGTAPKLDVNDPNSVSKILIEKTSLYQVFKIAESYDAICSEWVNNYPITFGYAYPFLNEQIRRISEPNEAIIHTFLRVLAEYPDTFITRKAGLNKSREVSSKAKIILQSGLATAEGKEQLREFDKELRTHSNLLNPGTTADVIAAALALCVLDGYRP